MIINATKKELKLQIKKKKKKGNVKKENNSTRELDF